METKLLKIKGTEELAVIDAEDYERVKSFNWQVEYSGKRQHVGCRIGKKGEQKCIRLSHMIFDCAGSDKKIIVKHINQNPFDLRKSNLRISDGGYKNVAPGTPIIRTYSGPPTLGIFLDKACIDKQKPSPWVVYTYSPELIKCLSIGKYASKQNAKNIVRYIEENNIPVSNAEEVELSRPIIRDWALANGFTNRHFCKLGDESIYKGYILIKTEKGWRRKHHVIWEEAGNTIPENHHLLFKDGNKRNFDLKNLEVISRGEMGQYISLLKYPKELRPTVELIWELKHEIKKQSKKKTRLLKVTGTDKLATVDTIDYKKVKDFDWKLIKVNGKKVVGYWAKIADRKYKAVTLAHKILDIDVEQKTRITHINKRALDHRRRNLNVVYFNRPDIIKPPLYYVGFFNNRKASKSNWKVDIWLLNRRSSLGYYLTEDSAKSIIAYAKALTLPLTNWDEYCAFREEIRRWAIENGHANKSTVLIGQEQRKGKPFNLHISFIKNITSKPWRVVMRCREVFGLENKNLVFGQFETEEIAKTVVDFINNCELPITNSDEAEKLRAFVKSWAIAKGYRDQSPNRKRRSEPVRNFHFDSINRGEILQCQTLQ